MMDKIHYTKNTGGDLYTPCGKTSLWVKTSEDYKNITCGNCLKLLRKRKSPV